MVLLGLMCCRMSDNKNKKGCQGKIIQPLNSLGIGCIAGVNLCRPLTPTLTPSQPREPIQ